MLCLERKISFKNCAKYCLHGEFLDPSIGLFVEGHYFKVKLAQVLPLVEQIVTSYLQFVSTSRAGPGGGWVVTGGGYKAGRAGGGATCRGPWPGGLTLLTGTRYKA